MNLPSIFQAIIGVMLSLSAVAALASFIMAGLRLRAEGGVNYDAGGGFFKWMFWGAVFLTLPGIAAWLSGQGVSINLQGASNASTIYTTLFQSVLSTFMDDIVVGRIVPVLAATLVVKAVLDATEGNSPLPSIIASLFLLGVKGIHSLAIGWNTGDSYATTNVLQNMFLYLATVICPLIGGLCISAAILCYIRNRAWGHLVATGLAFLCVPGLWALVKAMAGVSLAW